MDKRLFLMIIVEYILMILVVLNDRVIGDILNVFIFLFLFVGILLENGLFMLNFLVFLWFVVEFINNFFI